MHPGGWDTTTKQHDEDGKNKGKEAEGKEETIGQAEAPQELIVQGEEKRTEQGGAVYRAGQGGAVYEEGREIGGKGGRNEEGEIGGRLPTRTFMDSSLLSGEKKVA